MSPRELLKYQWRSDKFIEKYINGDVFELTSGRIVKLIYSESIVQLIQAKEPESLRGRILLTTENESLRFSDLNKTPEFGGKGKNFGVQIELRQIESFNKALDEYKVIPLKIGNRTYDVLELQKTQGIPKSDFHFVDRMKKEIVWISHKDGKRAFDFQQYSGITEVGIHDDKEVKDFIEAVRRKFPNGIDRATTVARKIDNRKIKMKAIYGIQFGGPFGRHNVTVLLQGDLTLAKSGNMFSVDAFNVHPNGDDLNGEYEPVLMATYKGDRDGEGVKGARFTISPIKARKINEMI